jgi:hypothetical protein
MKLNMKKYYDLIKCNNGGMDGCYFLFLSPDLKYFILEWCNVIVNRFQTEIGDVKILL